MNALRRRLEHSRLLAWCLAQAVRGYLILCQKTINWRIEGREALHADLRSGPVLLVMWHERSLMGPVHWPIKQGQLSSLYASSAIGRVSGAMQRQCGLLPMEMSDHQSNIAASRRILQRVREGVSIGMTGDGPLGPALMVKDAPLEWARAMQRPVWGYAFATRRHFRLKAWDRMMVPRPFGQGAIVFRRLDHEIVRKADPAAMAAAAKALARLLDDIKDHADELAAG